MNIRIKPVQRKLILTAILVSFTTTPVVASELDNLRSQVEIMKQQLDRMEQELQQRSEKETQIEVLERKVEKIEQTTKPSNSIAHLAGYASVGYTDNENTSGRFNQVQFSPIFHYMYNDLMMLESELEISIDAAGETKTELEYLTLDLFLNDYAALVAGKFLSPVGQFRQNLHPGWINKLPSAPPGFGHDGAAPISEVGIQVRGGFAFEKLQTNYALYLANGPEINAVDEDGEIELESIVAEGKTADAGGKKVFGGRFGILPIPGLEIGLSFITGKASITKLVDEDAGTSAAVASDPSRDYEVFGGDFAWNYNYLTVRGEFVKSRIGNATGSIAAQGADWQTWYTQASYKLMPSKLEGALRYTDFDSPHASERQKQWALGLNYIFASNVIAKIAYEFNDGLAGRSSDDDSLLMQVSYGF